MADGRGSVMTALRQAAEDYLQIRRALGYKLERDGVLLLRFIDFVEVNAADTVTIELAMAWATPSVITPSTWQRRLIVVRGFARYLQTIDPRAEIPPTDILPGVMRRPAPHIYSDTEILALMAAASRWRSKLGRVTLETMIGLLAVTGMRISEAVGLDRSDLDLEHARLVVRNSKFGKSRQLPLHPTTIEVLQKYFAVCDRLRPQAQTSALLLSTRGQRLTRHYAEWQFAQLRQRVELAARPGARPPRLHDLRHTFAVRTMMDSYRTNGDPRARLAQLSTYLGHADPAASYWYLSATPELLGLAAARLQNHLAESEMAR
jgi:integrase/recombinase XerD